jgi:hypothetical protein
MGVKLIFIEVINNDPIFLKNQIKLAIRSSPDYAEVCGSEEAVRSLLSSFCDDDSSSRRRQTMNEESPPIRSSIFLLMSNTPLRRTGASSNAITSLRLSLFTTSADTSL